MDDETFRPVRLAVRPLTASGVDASDSGIAIVAEDATGRYCGITADRELGTLLDQFLPTSGPRFLEFWSTYESERGGDCFFWDLERLARAIVSSPDLPALRRLSGARTAADFMHNAYQANLMVLAHRLRAGSVELLRAGGAAKSPDFSVTLHGVVVPCEVKTITRRNVVDIVDEGLQIAERDRGVFIETLRAKIGEAVAQTGPSGVAIVAICCDSLGMALSRVLPDWGCSSDGLFVAGLVVLTCRDHGEDRWFAFPVAETPDRLAELRRRLDQVIPPPCSIPFTASAVSVANGMTWMSAGRTVAINNRQTPTEYEGDQLAPYRASRPFRDVPFERLLLWQARWRLVEGRAEAYRSAAETIERRSYTLDQWIELPAGVALMHWLACLQPTIHEAFDADPNGTSPLLTGVLSEDYRKIEPLIGQAAAAFWGGPDVGYVGAALAALVTSRQTLGALKRVTSGYGTLLQEELAVRRADEMHGGPNR